MKMALLALLAATLFPDTERTVVMVEVYDYTAPAFTGVISVGINSYTFAASDARERKSYGEMRIRQILIPIDREAILTTSGSEWPVSICLQVPATQYEACIPTNKSEILRGTIFSFGPEGWSRQ